MLKFRSLCRALPVLILLSALVITSLPAQAQPVRRPLSKVAVLGEGAFAWVRNLLTGLGLPGMRKEGMSIDPNGGKSPEGTSIDPNGGLDDEGMSIDPDGRT